MAASGYGLCRVWYEDSAPPPGWYRRSSGSDASGHAYQVVEEASSESEREEDDEAAARAIRRPIDRGVGRRADGRGETGGGEGSDRGGAMVTEEAPLSNRLTDASEKSRGTPFEGCVFVCVLLEVEVTSITSKTIHHFVWL